MTAMPRVPADVPCKRRPDAMFPDTRNNDEVEAARDICESGVRGDQCPFLGECLSYALQNDVEGVWAGTTEDERRGIRRRHGIVAEKLTFGRGIRVWGLEPCGTPAAYRRHIRNGEPSCGACLDAANRRKHPENNSQWQAS